MVAHADYIYNTQSSA